MAQDFSRFPLTTLAAQAPNQPLLYTDEQTLSRQQVLDEVQARAAVLHQAALSPGDHVALISHTSSELLFWILACWHQQLVACPLSPRWPQATREQLRQQLTLRAGWWEQGDPGISQLPRLTSPSAVGQTNTTVAERFVSTQPATLVLTSGSTGMPKAVQHTFEALAANANGCLLPFTATDNWLLSLPLYHIGGIAVIVRTLLQGASWTLPAARQQLLSTLERHPVTHISLVSTQLYRLLQHPQFHAEPLPLTTLMLGGGPFSPTLLAAAKARGFASWLSYGLSEFAAQVVTAPARDDGMMAIAGSHAQLTVKEDELCLRGPAALQGYYHHGQLRQPFDEQGWYHTGDLAQLSNGYLRLIGRRDNRFISGGENIQPELIEQVLLQHATVAQAIVVPVDHPEYGQRPVVFIDSKKPVSLPQVQHWLQDCVPRFMYPDAVWPWPANQTGLKPSRAALRQHAMQLLQH